MSCAAIVLGLGVAGGVIVIPEGGAEAAVSEKSIRFFDKAQGHVKKGDLNAAVIQLKNAIRSDANNVDARFQLAEIYLAIGNPEGAEKELKAARARGYDRLAIAPILAQTYILQGKFNDLLDDFQDEKLEGESQAILSVYRAQAHINLRQFEDAAKALEEARAAKADMPQIPMVNSWLRQSEGDLAGAEALIDVALKSIPDNVDALMQKAELRRLASDQEGAIDFATRALEINQFRRAPRVTRGLALAALGRVEETIADAEILLERNENDPLGAFLKGWGHAQKGETELALTSMAGRPGLENFAPALYLGAALHLKVGALEQARAQIDKYLVQAPGNLQALVTSGAIYYQAGDYEAAAKALEPVYQSNQQNARVVTMLAYAYEKAGDQGKAAALFDEAINLQPGNEDLQLRAAQAKIGSGDLESGMADLASLADAESGGERAATLLFLTRLRTRDFAAAGDALDRLEAISGKTAETENFRASVALATGDSDGAEKFLRSSLVLKDDYQAARLNLARLFRVRKDVDGATAEYEKLLEQQPGYLPAITGLVEIAKERQDESAILQLIDMAARKNRSSEKAHLLRVEQLLSLGRKEKALVAARDFIAALPESPAAYDALARGQIAAGDQASAIVTYQQLANRAPDNPMVWFRLAQAQILRENHTDAMFALEKVIALDPSNGKARQQRIDMERRVHGEERALAMARKLFAEAPEGPDQMLDLGRTLVEMGQPREGLELVKNAYEATKGKKELVALYRTYDRIGKPEEATRVMTDWIGEHPEDTDIQLVLFSRLISFSNWADAIELGERLYRADAKNFVVMNNLAWVYEQVGRIDEAKSFAKSAVELAPEAAEIIDTYGWILYEHGDAKEAEAVLAKSAALVPARRDIQYHHAAALAKIGNKDAAITKLRGLLADDSAFAEREAAAALLGDLE